MLILEKISVDFKGTTILSDFNFVLNDGDAICFYGPSGIGKTTLLNVAAGLLKPSRGTRTTSFHNIAYVFQDDRLLPWLSAIKNIEFTLKGTPKKTLAKDLMARLGLQGEEDKLPSELSGGMQKRVNLARALANDPDLLILDEPFNSLDDENINRCLQEILRWKQRCHGTILAISHLIEKLKNAGFTCHKLDFSQSSH